MPPTDLRSRQGCTLCRQRHRKCDEAKPACTKCRARGVPCVYGRAIKWSVMAGPGSFGARKGRRKGDVGGGEAAAKGGGGEVVGEEGGGGGGEEECRVWTPVGEEEGQGRFVEGREGICAGRTGRLIVGEDEAWHEESQEGDSAACAPDLDAGREKNAAEPGTVLPNESEASTGDNILNLQHPMQSFQSTDEEMAYNYYSRHLSSAIPAHDSHNNPYRKLGEIAVAYPVLLHTVISVATDHMFAYGRCSPYAAALRQSRALQSLQEALGSLNEADSNDDSHKLVVIDPKDSNAISILSPREALLAAILLQITTCITTGSGTTEAHMRCAVHFLSQLNYFHTPVVAFFPRLIVQRFAMVDVVLSFLRYRKPLAPATFTLYQADLVLDHTEPSFREMTGCPQPVLAFLARIAFLAEDGSASLISAEAYRIQTDLSLWGARYHLNLDHDFQVDQDPPCGPCPSLSELDTKVALDALSECFYWTAHLLLMRRVFHDPTVSPRVQSVRRHMFRLIQGIPVGCGPDSSLPFPFYVAAREALTTAQRDWVRQKHVAMKEVYRDRARDLMMESAEEIWKRTDANAASASDIKEVDMQASHFMF